jgi:hypothetical protein
MSDEQKREKARTALQDGVYQMIEAGYSATEVEEEVKYALEDAEGAGS